MKDEEKALSLSAKEILIAGEKNENPAVFGETEPSVSI